MLRKTLKLLLAFCIFCVGCYISHASAYGFNHPQFPTEAPVCLFFMFMAPVFAIAVIVRMFISPTIKRYAKHLKEKQDESK